MINVAAIKARFEALAPVLDERERRLFAASEAANSDVSRPPIPI
jgi:hypothetical protein